MKWRFRMMKGWQVGVLFGLTIGLVQAISGNLEIASLSVEEGIVRLATTMFGSALLCGFAGGVVTGTTRREETADDGDVSAASGVPHS